MGCRHLFSQRNLFEASYLCLWLDSLFSVKLSSANTEADWGRLSVMKDSSGKKRIHVTPDSELGRLLQQVPVSLEMEGKPYKIILDKPVQYEDVLKIIYSESDDPFIGLEDEPAGSAAPPNRKQPSTVEDFLRTTDEE